MQTTVYRGALVKALVADESFLHQFQPDRSLTKISLGTLIVRIASGIKSYFGKDNYG